MKKSSKKTYVFIGILVLSAVIFYFYWKGKSTPALSTLEMTDMADEAVGARVFGLLNQINSLKIDATLFRQPAYATLQDYTVQIAPLPVGRVNPFAPISGAPSGTGTEH